MNKERIIQFIRERQNLFAAIIFSIFYFVGFLGHIFKVTRPYMLAMTPYFLVIFGILAILPVLREKSRGVLFWAAGTMMVTFFLESLGTKTGLVFGAYTYGRTLGVSLLEVPPVIAFNWLLVVIGSIILSSFITKKAFFTALFAGAFAVLFDFVMEPIAITFSYWWWHGEVIPLQNYIAWFLIAFASALVFGLMKLDVKSRIPMIYVLVQFAFFIGLRLTVV